MAFTDKELNEAGYMVYEGIRRLTLAIKDNDHPEHWEKFYRDSLELLKELRSLYASDLYQEEV